MNAAIGRLALCLGLVLVTTQAMPTANPGVFAIIDAVELEPSDLEPERIWISGVFVVPQPMSSGHFRPPSHGHLYFSLHPKAPSATRADWEALRKLAGTGQVVGFGEYWTRCKQLPRGETRFRNQPDSNCSFEVTFHTDRSLAVPQPYPVPRSDGVVTTFDGQEHACAGSAQIAFDLREAHSPGIAQNDPPVCIERIGLLSSSELASAFGTQTRDPEWAAAAETLILQRLADAPGLALSELGVECRDTVCHVRLAFPTRQYQETAGNTLAADALDELPGFAPGAKLIRSRDKATMEYYVQRRKIPPAPPPSAD
jgi:hypothetical protein